MSRFEDESSLWTRVVTREYAEKWDLIIDPNFQVKFVHRDWDDWVVVNVPLGWSDPEGYDLW